MGQQIIRQPDGKLAVFSTVVDGFLLFDATPEEVIEWRAQCAADNARERTRAELERVLDVENPKPYLRFTLTWGEALALHNGHDDSDN